MDRAESGISHAVALVAVLFILVFMILFFSTCGINKESQEQKKLSREEQKAFAQAAFMEFLYSTSSWKGEEITMLDFLSQSLVSQKDEQFFRNKAVNYFDQVFG